MTTTTKTYTLDGTVLEASTRCEPAIVRRDARPTTVTTFTYREDRLR